MVLIGVQETERLREVLLPELLSLNDLGMYELKFLHELNNRAGEFTFNDAMILQVMQCFPQIHQLTFVY